MKKRIVICKDFNVQINKSDFFHIVNDTRCMLWVRQHPHVQKFKTRTITSASAFFGYVAGKRVR